MAATDQAGFDEFVAASAGRLLRLAYGVTGDRGLAEDLVQEALAKTYLRWGRIRDRGAVEAYARRVVVTTHVSLWRRRRVSEVLTADLPHESVSDACGSLDDRDALWLALRALGRRQRAVLVLRYFEDRDDAEIADLLGCTTATVRSQAARGLARLRLVRGLAAATPTPSNATDATNPNPSPKQTGTIRDWSQP